jgi:hypothetical protein
MIGQLHACDHNAHTWISRRRLIDNLLKIVLDLINGHSSKGIVDSELQNEDVDPALQVPREPLQAAFRGAAGGTGVRNLKIEACSAQFLRQQHRVGFTWRESETLGETVAQDENRFLGGAMDRFNR